MAEDKIKAKTVTLINAGKHNFRTSAGEFLPQGSVTLPEGKEADLLLGHAGVFKAGDYKAPVGALEALTAKVAALEAENAELKKKLAKG